MPPPSAADVQFVHSLMTRANPAALGILSPTLRREVGRMIEALAGHVGLADHIGHDGRVSAFSLLDTLNEEGLRYQEVGADHRDLFRPWNARQWSQYTAPVPFAWEETAAYADEVAERILPHIGEHSTKAAIRATAQFSVVTGGRAMLWRV